MHRLVRLSPHHRACIYTTRYTVTAYVTYTFIPRHTEVGEYAITSMLRSMRTMLKLYFLGLTKRALYSVGFLLE